MSIWSLRTRQVAKNAKNRIFCCALFGIFRHFSTFFDFLMSSKLDSSVISRLLIIYLVLLIKNESSLVCEDEASFKLINFDFSRDVVFFLVLGVVFADSASLRPLALALKELIMLVMRGVECCFELSSANMLFAERCRAVFSTCLDSPFSKISSASSLVTCAIGSFARWPSSSSAEKPFSSMCASLFLANLDFDFLTLDVTFDFLIDEMSESPFEVACLLSLHSSSGLDSGSAST